MKLSVAAAAAAAATLLLGSSTLPTALALDFGEQELINPEPRSINFEIQCIDTQLTLFECLTPGTAICRNGWAFGISRKDGLVKLWDPDGKVHYEHFPHTKQLCIGEKTADHTKNYYTHPWYKEGSPYLFVIFDAAKKTKPSSAWLVCKDVGKEHVDALLKIVDYSDRPDGVVIGEDPVLKFKEGPGYDNALFWIDAFGRQYQDANCFWYYDTPSPTSSPTVAPTPTSTTTCGAFHDISADGTAVLPNEIDEIINVPMSGTFTFYGIDYADVFISVNGLLAFGNETGQCPQCFDVPSGFSLPDPDVPDNLIAPLWNDLSTEDGGNITYKYVVDMTDSFVTQWTEVPEFNSTNANTFQVALFFDSGCIEFRYESIDLQVLEYGVFVGTENSDGTVGLNIDTSGITDGSTTCLRLCYDGSNYVVVSEQ